VWARLWTAAAVVLLFSTGAASDEVIEANLKVVGRYAVEPPAVYGDLTVVGATAVVATEAPAGPCAGASAAVLNIKDAGKPRVVATISLPAATVVADLDSTTVQSERFTGDLLSLALSPCAGGPPTSVAYYDITEPATPRMLSQTAGAASVSLAQRPDGRVVAARASAAGIAIDDLSDPRAPVALASWSVPSSAGGCGAVSVQLYDDGELAAAALAGGVYTLDLIEPPRLTAAGPAEGGGGHVGVLPLGNRTIAVVAEDGSCPPGEPGLRVLTVEPREPPVDAIPLRYAGTEGPGRLVASGGYAYVAWHGAGLRVVDFAEVRAKTVAQFVPANADVVGVALLAEHVVVSDAYQGLFILERPEEGGGRATFWSQFLTLMQYLGGAMFLAALFVVPRLAMGRSPVGSRVPVPGAEPVRRRRRA
jgi:hypothetical protein